MPIWKSSVQTFQPESLASKLEKETKYGKVLPIAFQTNSHVIEGAGAFAFPPKGLKPIENSNSQSSNYPLIHIECNYGSGQVRKVKLYLKNSANRLSPNIHTTEQDGAFQFSPLLIIICNNSKSVRLKVISIHAAHKTSRVRGPCQKDFTLNTDRYCKNPRVGAW